MTALIDADSIMYILGYQFRDQTEIAAESLFAACGEFVRSICTMTQSEDYVGAFSSSLNFRHEVYKYKPYKGTRPPKPEFIEKWGDPIRDYLINEWNFYRSPNLEADDIVAALSTMEASSVICSPDKDLKQMPGLHYNYGKGELAAVDEQSARFAFWTQMLTGDTSDNIAGLPGLGPKKVQDLFATILKEEDGIELQLLVKSQYTKYFGDWYGEIIFGETLQTVMLMQPKHPLWNDYKDVFQTILTKHRSSVPQMDVGLNEPALNELGWLE